MTAWIDIGFGLTLNDNVRIFGIDCPELRTKDEKEKAAGYAVRDYVRELVLDKTVTIRAFERDKYGRYLVDIIFGETTLTELLIDEGFCKEYYGEKKEEWV